MSINCCTGKEQLGIQAEEPQASPNCSPARHNPAWHNPAHHPFALPSCLAWSLLSSSTVPPGPRHRSAPNPALLRSYPCLRLKCHQCHHPPFPKPHLIPLKASPRCPPNCPAGPPSPPRCCTPSPGRGFSQAWPHAQSPSFQQKAPGGLCVGGMVCSLYRISCSDITYLQSFLVTACSEFADSWPSLDLWPGPPWAEGAVPSLPPPAITLRCSKAVSRVPHPTTARA